MTARELLNPHILMRPMRFEDWRMRAMIIECERRQRVLDRKADPTPFEPWKFCDPAELKAFLKLHSAKDLSAVAAASPRDNYGIAGAAGRGRLLRGKGGRVPTIWQDSESMKGKGIIYMSTPKGTSSLGNL